MITDFITPHTPHPTPLTHPQVDDLKEKLAAQEVELKQKNDDADALIKRVGVEQEKVCTHHMYAYVHCSHTLPDNFPTPQVSKEKEVADEEEQKVAKINEEVSKKQRDCEQDLAKAEPALKAAAEALNTLNKVYKMHTKCTPLLNGICNSPQSLGLLLP